MASSGCSTGARMVPTADDECVCGMKLKLLTSWSVRNPDRRFWSCGQRVNVCGYFYWFDERMCERAKYVIHDLKSKVTQLEDDLKICTAELGRLEEALRVERNIKPSIASGYQPLPLRICVVLIFGVFVAVLLANFIIK